MESSSGTRASHRSHPTSTSPPAPIRSTSASDGRALRSRALAREHHRHRPSTPSAIPSSARRATTLACQPPQPSAVCNLSRKWWS
ncbi:hypothetical protein B0A49_12788, partial [Cryomyces minteri]